jgi:hypothetical protein
MRTVKIGMEMPGPTIISPIVSFSTEVIVNDDDDAAEAGHDAGKYLMRFAEGFASVADDD